MTTAERPGDASLAATLIVKDEEERLPKCLESLRALGDLVTEIVVYDTGSTDRTIEIAESFGCRVQRGYWDDDFARARNCALDLASAPWCLVLDADERIQADPIALRAWLSRSTADGDPLDGHSLEVRSYSEGRLLPAAGSIRILRRASCHYEGAVHERVRRRTGSDTTPIVSAVPVAVATITHEGYAGTGTLERKAQRNLRISDLDVSRARAAGTPGQLGDALMHRARSHAQLGMLPEALQDCNEVLEFPGETPWRRYAGELKFEILRVSGRLGEAARLLADLAAEGEDRQWLLWSSARLQRQLGRPAEALAALRQVDEPRNGLGESIPRETVLQELLAASVESQSWDDAAAASLTLISRYGIAEHAVHVAAALWQDRSARELVTLLRAGGGRAGECARAFAAEGDFGLEVSHLLASAAGS